MSYEDVGIRLRTDGVVESTTGVNLLGNALDGLANRANSAVPGLGGVTRALGGMTGVMGGVAAAAAVVGVAWFKGGKEAQEYARAIIMTGNAAGVTQGQLQALAQNVDVIVGTQSQAAEVLAKLVSTGNVSRGQLEQATQAAISLQRSLGVEVDKTVTAFSALGRDPLKASIKLNESTNFLTLSVYEQIKALEKQGREAEAGAVAQNAYADVIIERSKNMETQLGLLERGWRGVKEGASEAWDAMLGIGRKGTAETELAGLQNQIRQLENMQNDPTLDERGRVDLENSLSQLREKESIVQSTLREFQRGTDLQARNAAAVKGRIAADGVKTGRAPKPAPLVDLDTDTWDAKDFLNRRKNEEFERDHPPANVSEILRSRSVNAAFRAAELAGYEETNKELMRMQRDAEAEQRSEAKKTADYLQRLEDKRLADLRPQWRDMVAEWNDVQLEMRRSADDVMFATLRSAEDAWVRWATTGKLSIRDVFATFVAEQARAGFRQLAGAGLNWLLGSSGGSAAGNVAGELIDFGTGSAFPGRAGGGDVQAGQAYVVGEKGPELLFMGRQSGTVVPNDKLGGSGGGRAVTFAPVINIDARSDQAQVAAIINRAMQAAQADLLEKMDRREI